MLSLLETKILVNSLEPSRNYVTKSLLQHPSDKYFDKKKDL